MTIKKIQSCLKSGKHLRLRVPKEGGSNIFVVAWETGQTPFDVAQLLKIPLHLVECWYYEYARAGVRLKPMLFTGDN